MPWLAAPSEAGQATIRFSERTLLLMKVGQRPAYVGRRTVDYGSNAVMFRFGTCPTGMRVTSFIVLISTTDTEFDWALAT